MNSLRFTEHQKIFVSSPSKSPDQNSLTRHQFEKLKKISPELPADSIQWHPNAVTFRHYCGVISLGAVSIEILPKIFDKDPDWPQSRTVLIALLSATGKITFRSSGKGRIHFQGRHLLEYFVQRFCEELNQFIQQGLHKEYIVKEKKTATLKGQPVLKEIFAKGSAPLVPVVCRFEEFTQNNPLNQAIKWCLKGLQKLPFGPKNQQNIQGLLRCFEGVTEPKGVFPLHTLPVIQGRMLEKYDGIIHFIKMFAAGLHPDVITGETRYLSLLFDMNRLFEEFVRQRIQKLSGRLGMSVSDKNSMTHLAYWKKYDKNLFKLVPDILLTDERTGALKAMIEVKWKRVEIGSNKMGVSSDDFYQIYAYLAGLGCKKALLLYPIRPGVKVEQPNLDLLDTKKSLLVRFIDLGYLAQRGMSLIDEQLLKILAEFKDSP